MIPYALAAGALVAALGGWPWGLAGLVAALLLWRRPRLALAYSLALVLVLLRLLSLGDPWAELVGSEVTVAGELRRGVVHAAAGPLYLDYYPQLADGWVRARGRLVRPPAARNPGDFDRRAWLRGLGVYAELEDAEVLSYRAASGVRTALRRRLLAGLTPQAAALARALTLGERRALGDERTAFGRAGLAHLLALSGLHVGILVGFFLLLGFPLGRWRYPLALALLVGYVALVGPTPSLLRATVMAAVWLLARTWGREAPPAALLALALFLHLLYAPYAVWSLSFQLSYLAVLGIIIAFKELPARGWWLAWPRDVIIASLAAEAAILPLLLHYFSYLPILSPLANLLAIPLATLLVPLGFVKAVLPHSALLAAPFNHLASLLLATAHLFARAPLLHWGRLDASGFALYYLGLLPLILWWRGFLDARPALGLSAAVVLVASLSPTARPDVWFFDVGQGDAALIRLQHGVEVLVDAGHEWDAPRLRRALAALGVDDLDLIIGTHSDSDHVGGLAPLLAAFPVGALGLGPASGDPLETRILGAARSAGVPVVRVWRGRELRIGGAELRFVHPLPRPPGADNDRSLAFYALINGHRLFFAGDAPAHFALEWPPEQVEVLKVSHHGAANGTSAAVLRRLRPRFAWISVGAHNDYGHPSAAVLKLLERYGTTVHRSDREGAWRYPLY